MKINKYNYLLFRVEYPMERGYRMEPSLLPDWIYITITEEDDSKFLTVHSEIHVNKEVKLNPPFSSEFTDQEIIREMSGKVSHRFL